MKNPSALWARIIRTKYLDSDAPERIFTMSNPPLGPRMLNFVVRCRETLLTYLSWVINVGD